MNTLKSPIKTCNFKLSSQVTQDNTQRKFITFSNFHCTAPDLFRLDSWRNAARMRFTRWNVEDVNQRETILLPEHCNEEKWEQKTFGERKLLESFWRTREIKRELLIEKTSMLMFYNPRQNHAWEMFINEFLLLLRGKPWTTTSFLLPKILKFLQIFCEKSE
jgi:hypothetical protein